MQALRIFLFAFSLFLLVGAPFSFHFFSTSLPFSLCFFLELRQDTKIHILHRTLSFVYNEQNKPNTNDLDYPSPQ